MDLKCCVSLGCGRPRKGSRKGFCTCPVAKGSRSPLGCLPRSCCVSTTVAGAQTRGVAWFLRQCGKHAASLARIVGAFAFRRLASSALRFCCFRISENTQTSLTSTNNSIREIGVCNAAAEARVGIRTIFCWCSTMI